MRSSDDFIVGKYYIVIQDKYVEFKNKEFMRATSVLLSRCNKLEWIIWEQKK